MLRFEKDRKGCGVYVDYNFYFDGVVLASTKVLLSNCRLFADIVSFGCIWGWMQTDIL